MKTNNRLFKLVLLVSGILMIAGTAFLYAIRLDDPLFFRHYYDEVISSREEGIDHSTSDFSYITNRYDDRDVVGMSFPDYPGVTIQVSRHEVFTASYNDDPQIYRWEDIVGHYSVRKVNWEIVDVPEEVNFDNTLITQVKFLFDDSSEMLVDIGEIYLSWHTLKESPIEHLYGSSSSDGDTETRYKFEEDASIISVHSPTLESVPHTQSLKLNNEVYETLEGVHAEKEDTLTISSVVLPSEENEYDLHKSQLQVVFRNEDGEESEGVLQWLTSTRYYYEFFDLISYIQTRGGGE